MSESFNEVFFDLETQRSSDDVGGWQHIADMGLSVAGTYSTADNRYRFYTEHNVHALIKQLCAADRVIGFNIRKFDYTVLTPYTDQPLQMLPTVDMLRDIYSQLGFRVSLDNLAILNLGMQKTADGMEAIAWYKQGNLTAIAEYCLQDVRITRALYRLGQKLHYLRYPGYGSGRVPVPW
jgi:DEAD/DEAH box helicase domain-containing protein